MAQELKSLSPSPNKSGDAFNFSFKSGFKKWFIIQSHFLPVLRRSQTSRLHVLIILEFFHLLVILHRIKPLRRSERVTIRRSAAPSLPTCEWRVQTLVTSQRVVERLIVQPRSILHRQSSMRRPTLTPHLTLYTNRVLCHRNGNARFWSGSLAWNFWGSFSESQTTLAAISLRKECKRGYPRGCLYGGGERALTQLSGLAGWLLKTQTSIITGDVSIASSSIIPVEDGLGGCFLEYRRPWDYMCRSYWFFLINDWEHFIYFKLSSPCDSLDRALAFLIYKGIGLVAHIALNAVELQRQLMKRAHHKSLLTLEPLLNILEVLTRSLVVHILLLNLIQQIFLLHMILCLLIA